MEQTARPSRVMHAISQSISLIGLIVGLAAVALLSVIVYAGFSMNSSALRVEDEQIENAFNQAVIRTLDEQKSVAFWDKPLQHIKGGVVDTDWFDVEFGAFLSESYGHREIYVLNGAERPVYAYVDGERRDLTRYDRRKPVVSGLLDVIQGRRRLRPMPLRRDEAFAAQQARYAALGGAKDGRWGATLTSVDGKPAIVSAITMVPTIDRSLLVGKPYVLVSIVPIDQSFLDKVSASLLIPGLRLIGPDAVAGYSGAKALLDDNAKVITHLGWTARRPGKVLLVAILPLLVLATIAGGILIRALLRRLRRMSVELTAREQRSRHLALHDELTGLPNRRHFVEVLEKRLETHDAAAEGTMIVGYLDVDRFKDINDTLGHRTGDELVIAIGTRLTQLLGPNDMLARFGGDEFALLSYGPAGDGATRLGQRIRAVMEDPFHIGGQAISVTMSTGLAEASGAGSTSVDLIRQADIALYRAKDEGRSRWEIYNEEMLRQLEYRRALEVELRKAISENQLSLVYQPIISVRSDQMTGVEALLRWSHPEHGVVPPATFIPIAEASGLMPELGAWVLEQGFKDALRWPSLTVSINLSPVQVRRVDLLIPQLESLLKRYRVNPSRIVFEIPEGVLIDANERTRDVLAQLGAIGFKLALDDFGAGYSSLSYLRDFKFDRMKIDRSFIDGDHAREASTIVQAMAALGSGLGMEIVAKSIQTESEARLMRYAGCTELQGNYFSKPLNAEVIEGLVMAAEDPRPVQRRIIARQ